MTSKVLIELLSSGITCILFHVPQAYWKKSTQGSAVRSIADKSEAAKMKRSFHTNFFTINKIKMKAHHFFYLFLKEAQFS